MSEKRKISIRKVIQTLVTILAVAGCAVAMLSADRLQNNKKLGTVTVHIRNSNKVQFQDQAQVLKLLFTDRHIDPQNTTLAKLDIHKMETIARTNPWVSDAQVYVDNERNVNVYITQRVPVARLFETNGNSYYLDTALRAMPVSTTYVHYTPVVTGAPQLRDDSAGRAKKGVILSLVGYITRHPFWNAQIAQIVIADENNFELIPVLGKQRILLGDTSRMAEKLDHLFAFYQQVANKVGWDKYETIDLRYQDQVVASPAIKWKVPVDRALSNMNWVKAVMESGDKNEKDQSAITDSGVIATVTPVVAAPKPQPVVAKPIVVAAAAIKPKPKVIAATPKPKTAAKPKPSASAKAPAKKPIVHSQPKPAKPAAKKDTKPVKKDKKTDPKKTKKADAKKNSKRREKARSKT